MSTESRPSESSATPRYWAVLPAAGGGTRMRSEQPKQYLPLLGRAVMEWSLGVLLAAEWIDGVVVVLAERDAAFATLPIARHPRLHVAVGGRERSVSVLAGLQRVEALSAGAESVRVLVHDAARPCVTLDEIERLRDGMLDSSGALLAIPVSDTVKRADGQRVIGTEDRSRLWRAQTPQLFGLADLMDALRRRVDDPRVTDEASAMEMDGHHPLLVEGRASNLKVTYPEDLALAAFWLRGDGAEGAQPRVAPAAPGPGIKGAER